MKRRIAICGGTSLGHALAAVLAADSANKVTIWTRQPERWKHEIRAIYLDLAEVRGELAAVSSEAAVAITGAEIIFICTPLWARRETLQLIAPHVEPGAWIGGIPGFGGFDWIAGDVLGERANVFGLQRVPYVRKTISYGEAVWISGIRPRLFVGTVRSSAAAEVASTLEALLSIPTSPLSSYAPVTLSASNSIFHPARLTSAFPAPAFELQSRGDQFYEHWDDAASEAYLALDKDVQALAISLGVGPEEAQPIIEHFGASSPADLTARIRSIRALRDRRLPTRRNKLDRESHYVTEDACFALPVLKRCSDRLNVETPAIDAALSWAEQASGRHLLVNNRLEGKDAGTIPAPPAGFGAAL